MQVYRISKIIHAEDLSGEGARLFGGRWNSKGTPVVYTSNNISLAVLENLVHFSTFTPPTDMRCVTFEIPDAMISSNYNNYVSGTHKSADIGDKWAGGRKSLGLKVPSAIVPAEYNILINPLHPEITKVKLIDNVEFPFDKRLFSLEA